MNSAFVFLHFTNWDITTMVLMNVCAPLVLTLFAHQLVLNRPESHFQPSYVVHWVQPLPVRHMSHIHAGVMVCVLQCLAEGLTSCSTEATSSGLSVARRDRILATHVPSLRPLLGNARQLSQLEVCPAGGLSGNKSAWRARAIFVHLQVHAKRCQ